MPTSPSPIIDVSDYYDGIREGTTEIDGREFRFKSRRLDIHEYSGDFESVDLFDLHPIEGDDEPLLATATFETVEPPRVAGKLAKTRVYWSIISEGDA